MPFAETEHWPLGRDASGRWSAIAASSERPLRSMTGAAGALALNVLLGLLLIRGLLGPDETIRPAVGRAITLVDLTLPDMATETPAAKEVEPAEPEPAEAELALPPAPVEWAVVRIRMPVEAVAPSVASTASTIAPQGSRGAGFDPYAGSAPSFRDANAVVPAPAARLTEPPEMTAAGKIVRRILKSRLPNLKGRVSLDLQCQNGTIVQAHVLASEFDLTSLSRIIREIVGQRLGTNVSSLTIDVTL